MGRLGFPILLTLATLVSAQTRGTVTVGSGAGSPGTVVTLPVTLALNSGTSIDTLSFGFRVVANGSAPALTSGVTFTKDSAMPPPSFTTPDPDALGITWLNLFSP